MDIGKLSLMPSHVAIRKPQDSQPKREDTRGRDAKARDMARANARRAKLYGWA